MAVDIKKMVDAICSLTVLELSKLVKALRDKFGLRTSDTIRTDINEVRDVDAGEDFNEAEEADAGESRATEDNKKDEPDDGDEPVHRNRRGGGETEAHKNLKNYIAKNPSAAELNESLAPGKTEYELPSSDKPDVLFQNTHCRIVVEVKSHISSKDDLRRGLFQCVKYKALLKACRIVKEKTYEIDAILAIEGSLPKELMPIRDKLDIKVIENVQVK